MGRRYEDDDGIISTQGVEALFEPTRDLLGMAADLSVANLEIPLSDQGYPHPTKSIVFRCAPENVSGLIYGGIDVVSLANNHILDYMEPAMIQTPFGPMVNPRAKQVPDQQEGFSIVPGGAGNSSAGAPSNIFGNTSPAILDLNKKRSNSPQPKP